MRLQEKAIENLEAAERLLDTRDGDLEPLNNAAASRAYYAAYGAVADRVLRSGRQLPGKGYFKHDSFPDDAFHDGFLTAELREVLVWLRDLRVKADYEEIKSTMKRPRSLRNEPGRSSMLCWETYDGS